MLENTLSCVERINLFDRVRFSNRISDNGQSRMVQQWGNTICYSRKSPHSCDLAIGVQGEDGTIYQISNADIVARLPAQQMVKPKFNLGNLVRVGGFSEIYSIEGIGLCYRGDRDAGKISYDLSFVESKQTKILPNVPENQLQYIEELPKNNRIVSTQKQFLFEETILLNQEIEKSSTVNEIITILSQRCCDRFNVNFAYLAPTIYPEYFPVTESTFLKEQIQQTRTICINDATAVFACCNIHNKRSELWNFSSKGSIAFIDALYTAGVRSLLCIPFRSNLGHIGAIAFFDSRPRTWENESLFLRSILTTLAAAIDRSNLLATDRAIEKTISAQAEMLVRERIEAQNQIAQQEKMAALGQLIAGIAHEINNPLNFITANLTPTSNYAEDILKLAQLCRDRCSSPDVRDYAEEIDLDFLIEDFPKILNSMKQGCDRVSNIVKSLRLFSRGDLDRPTAFLLEQGLESTLAILQGKLKRGITVKRNYADLPTIDCYAGQLNQVFMNIISNAIDALENCENPEIEIATRLDKEKAIVTIKDNGMGIPDDVRSRIFDPFFTTKPVGKGTGLGLSISHQIVVDKHCGTLECFSELGRGTEFRITIPISNDD